MVDHRDFTEAGDKKDSAPRPENIQPNVRWWEASGKNLSNAVYAQAKAIAQADTNRFAAYNKHVRLYGSHDIYLRGNGLTPYTAGPNTQIGAGPSREPLGFNLAQSAIDTLVSKMVKNKPKPFFLTSQGDSKMARKAQRLTKYCDGIFYENKAHAVLMPQAFRDSCIVGDGPIHVYSEHGRIKWARAPSRELLVDYLETLNGPEFARTMHRIRICDRGAFASLFPDRRADIYQLPDSSPVLAGAQKSVADLVVVLESWRLPSAPDAKDGKYCITAPNVAPFVERPYTKSYFPFAFSRFSRRPHGFWSQGAVEQLTPIQVELNRCLMAVQRSLYLGSTFKVLLHSSAKIVKSHLDNTIGAIIMWSGDHPPEYIVPPLVQPEVYQQIASLKQMGYEQIGVSMLSAASQKPAGLDSGRALREAVDIETDRFQLTGQGYEQLALDLAMLSIYEGKDMLEQEEDYRVRVPGKRFIEQINFSEVDMEEDEFVMQCFPISKLPSSPEGRLQTIQEMMQAGLIDPEAGRRLLDYPDLDAEEALSNAQLDYLHMILDKIIYEGKYTKPEQAYDNIAAARKLALEYYANGKLNDLEEERKQLLRDFLADLVPEQPALPPGGAPPPGAPPPGAAAPAPAAPMANPMPTPTSDLIPNTPAAA